MTEDDPINMVPERFRHLIAGPIKRIYPTDPEYICAEMSKDDLSKHSCMEMHNQTKDPKHRCCCGFEWEA